VSRPTKLEIDLSALEHNFHVVRSYAPKQKIVCCVKANAYGHGIDQVSHCLSKHTDALAVSSIDEAISLRKASVSAPILLLEGVFDVNELARVAQYKLWIVVHNQRQIDWLLSSSLCQADEDGWETNIWLKIDTGMHRLGVEPNSVPSLVRQLLSKFKAKNLRLMTHFACADEMGNPFTSLQISRFFDIENQSNLECSLANSAAIIEYPESHEDWVRPGFLLYGLSPFGKEHPSSKNLKPVMRFTTEIIDIKTVSSGEGVGYNHYWRAEKESRIAILAAGYGDGYPRNTKNGAPVFVKNQIAKTVGHVAMDMMMIDVSDLENIQIGDDVELWGTHVSVHDLAEHSGYSPYEFLTRMPSRAKRFFVNE